jgi:hypothetical protein
MWQDASEEFTPEMLTQIDHARYMIGTIVMTNRSIN